MWKMNLRLMVIMAVLAAASCMAAVSFSTDEFTAEDFDRAVKTMEDCKRAPNPTLHLTAPYFAPGGYYGNDWYQLDYSIIVAGYRWIDPAFATNSFLGCLDIQEPSGRFMLYSHNRLPDFANGAYRHSPERAAYLRLPRDGVSSLPKIFDAAGKLCAGTDDLKFVRRVYDAMARCLGWWRRERFDEGTGLYSAVFEETFPPYRGPARECFPVDSNVELAWAHEVTARLADRLGEKLAAAALRVHGAALRKAIGERLWNQEKGAFTSILLHKGIHAPLLAGATFDALRMGIASDAQRQALLALLVDTSRFGWNEIALNSIDRKDALFTTRKGHYCGNPCWYGSIWTLVNEGAARGLLESGETELATELIRQTLGTFKGHYAEFVHPFEGTPEGVKKGYGWSAAQCVDLLFGVLCGLSFDGAAGELTIKPLPPKAWRGHGARITDLTLPDGSRLDVMFTFGGETAIAGSLHSPSGRVTPYSGTGAVRLKTK